MSIRDTPYWRRVAERYRRYRYRLRERSTRLEAVPAHVVFLLPFIGFFIVFLAFPILYSFYLSFFEYQGISDATVFWIDLGFYTFELQRIADLQFVGLGHYATIFNDPQFYHAMENTLIIVVVHVPLLTVLALALALALNAEFVKHKKKIRSLLVLPVSTKMVAYSAVFLMLLNEQFGYINYMLSVFGINPIPWLQSSFWARTSIIGALTWRWLGYQMLILYAGLQNIPQHLYEAAEVDGASRWEKFRYVTVPQLRPVLLFAIVLSTIGSFKIFTEPFIITDGGPAQSTMTILHYIYRQAFEQGALGYASALSYILIVIVSILSIVQMKIGGADE